MQESKHTPTPWYNSALEIHANDGKVLALNVFDHVAPYILRGTFSDGHIVDPAEAQANAAFIVRAVNNHEALVEALREMVEMIESGDEHGEGSEWHVKARAALAAID